jgi:hypothetical protein
MRRTKIEPVYDEMAETLKAFRAWLQSQGLASATIRYYVADVQVYLRWLSEHPQMEAANHDFESADSGRV